MNPKPQTQVEGSCTGRHGFIVLVTAINNIRFDPKP